MRQGDAEPPRRRDRAVEEVSALFDYSDRIAGEPGRLWIERYAPHQRLFAGLMVDRNERVRQRASGGAILLDIGCGMGDLLVLLEDRYQSLRGIDPSPDMVGECRRNLALRGLDGRATVTQGVAEALEFADGSIDTVAMLDVYEHIRPPLRPRALAEIRRVLKPGGELFLATPSRAVLRFWNLVDNLLFLPQRLLLRRPIRIWSFVQKPHPESFVSRRELERDLAEAGFRLCRFERVGFYPAPERGGFVGPYLGLLYRFPPGFRAVEALFQLASRLGFANQKMLVRCTP